eukprot:Rmarinus@m.16546
MAEDRLQIAGSRTIGQDVRSNNVMAAVALANTVKSSLGPVGLDKMLVDEVGDVTITNDGATILKQLDVEHPAAKVLVELSGLQDKEVGDGTTSVVLLAAELLRRADELVRRKIHPTSIITGFRLAQREAVKYIQNNLLIPVDKLGKECLLNAAKTSMSSKIIGHQKDYFSQMVVDAVCAVKTKKESGDVHYPIKAINVLKQHGKSLHESQLVKGYALNCTRAAEGMPKFVKNAKIALLDVDLRKAKMQLGVQVLINDPKELAAVQQRESDITKERIQLLLNAGANVVLTTKGIDDTSMKSFVEAGAIGVRRVTKDDLRRIAKATGGTMILSFANMEGEESFDPSYLGHAEEVSQERISDDELIVIKGCKSTASQSIILRGANEYMLDEMERSVHDAICVVKRTLESSHVVPGGGAVEAALSIYLENFAHTLGSREQLAIVEFAEGLLSIPKILAVNGAKDAPDLVAKLRAVHNMAQKDPNKAEYAQSGLDLFNGKIRNNVEAGVLEPGMSKIKSIQFATEAAITILRIDEMIKLDPKQEPGQQDECM